jgi:Bacterial sugar transferase
VSTSVSQANGLTEFNLQVAATRTGAAQPIPPRPLPARPRRPEAQAHNAHFIIARPPPAPIAAIECTKRCKSLGASALRDPVAARLKDLSRRGNVLDTKNIAVCTRNNHSPWRLRWRGGCHPSKHGAHRNEHARVSSPQVARHTDARSDRTTSRCEEFHLRSLAVGGMVKRISDLVIASFALIFFLPIFGLVEVTIAVFDGRPVPYRHSRVGYGRRPVLCLKFRMLVANGDKI